MLVLKYSKRISLYFFPFLILFACDRHLKEALKNGDIDYIIVKGDDFFSQKKYSQALRFYEQAMPFAEEDKIIKDLKYKIAISNFYNKSYTVSGREFKNFYNSYSSDKRAEEALFYSGYSYYLSSLDYNLDQKNTYIAIEELKNFISIYPKSKKGSEAIILIQNLTKKLEKKYFEIAKTYYDIMRYKSSIKVFEQFINNFPKSTLIEKIKYYIIDSKHKLLLNNIQPIKKERFQEILDMIEKFIKSYPGSSYTEKIMDIQKKVLQNIE